MRLLADVRCGRAHPHARSAVKHRPADVVPQPLVVKNELTNRLRELVTLPVALESPCGLALAFWRGSTCGLDRIGGCTEFVCRDVCDGPGLASSVRGIPCCPTQVSGRAHCMAARRASLHHRDLTTRPAAGVLDRFTRSWVLRPSQFEQVKDVLRARRRPKSEEMVIRIGEGPTATNRHEARVPNLREDHGSALFLLVSVQPHRAPKGAGRVLNRSAVRAPEPTFGVVRPGTGTRVRPVIGMLARHSLRHERTCGSTHCRSSGSVSSKHGEAGGLGPQASRWLAPRAERSRVPTDTCPAQASERH